MDENNSVGIWFSPKAGLEITSKCVNLRKILVREITFIHERVSKYIDEKKIVRL